jgi:hypothetical protein
MLDQTQTDRASSIQNLAARSLCPRVKLPMHSFQPLLIDVRIDLRGGNIGMPQHLLDDSQIGAVPEQMRRETVSKKVWINIFLQSGTSRVFLHDLPDTRCS